MRLVFPSIISFIKILITLNVCNALPTKSYSQLRENLIEAEEKLSFGGSLKLRGDEIIANKCLMIAKFSEVDEAYKSPRKFLPAKEFLDVREQIERSEVFKIIHRMPKGAVLHAHSTSIGSLDFLIKNTLHLPNLYICFDNGNIRFHFFEKPTEECTWKLLKDVRKNDPSIDSKIKKSLTLLSTHSGVEGGIDGVWHQFQEIFYIIKGLITYRPVFEKYFYQAMQEMHDDNVMYIEFRASFSPLYEINGTTYDPVNVATIFKEVVDRFTRAHPGFIGAKVIYSPNRKISQEIFDNYVKIYGNLKRALPDFVAGFDLVGQEEKGQSLLNFAEKLKEVGKEASFFFHAGETNWYGHSADDNLIDAVLLNTKRIGHGYALIKHPKLLDIVKTRKIAVELNPISNQVLKLVKDMRNHPASYLFAENFPVVVSNDDPSFWGATGLSYDYYEAFVGIMSREANLAALKQLAINSIEYSGLKNNERKKAYSVWEKAWEKFVRYLAHEHKCVIGKTTF